ncbi:RNase H domain-containing protein [Trichonephila clavipes]|nr:RNase H domain-containing protein [Trichonephila clavipes]
MLAEPDFKSIWILTDNRSSIQNVSNWKKVGDRVETFFLRLIYKLSANFEFHFQWILSHVGMVGNEIADSLAKAASLDTPRPDIPFTFSEVFSDNKKRQRNLWTVPPGYDWCPLKRPGGALLFEGHKGQQT